MLYDKRWDAKLKTTEIEPWRKALLDAADLIEQRGHAKKTLEDIDGSLCMGGAISMAITGKSFGLHPDMMEAYCALHDFCGGSFVTYNNAPERTASEVIATLRACALES